MATTMTEYAVADDSAGIWPPHVLWHDICTKTRARRQLRDERQHWRELGASEEHISKIILLEREVRFENWRRMT